MHTTTLRVHDMTCGHCVAAITRAVQVVDADAKVAIDLATHRVAIDSKAADAAPYAAAIADAGYTAQPVVDSVSSGTTPARRSGGCCSG